MSQNVVTETHPTPTPPKRDRNGREPVHILVVGSRPGITAVVHWLVSTGFTQMAEWSGWQRTPTGQWMRVLIKWVRNQ